MRRSHAIVIGASMAGLITARVLSEHFEKVIVLERDEPGEAPEPRKGVPQGRHLHALLAPGLAHLDRFFPGLVADLVSRGAIQGDPGLKTIWYVDGGYRTPTPLGQLSLLATRPLIETTVRHHVQALPNVTLLTGVEVRSLIVTPDKRQVLGVRLERRNNAEAGELHADLVVDCSGRGSAAPRWLAALGYARPAEEAIKVDLMYATRLYRRRPEQGDLARFISPTPPHETRGAAMFPVEGERWILTQAGYLGDHPPADEPGFNAFAASLPAPDIHKLILDSEPVSEIMTFKYPASLRRRYDRLTHHPEGLLVLGDAHCSFNPIYGQGMTSGIQQAVALYDLLTQAAGQVDGLWRRFYPAAARVVDQPWQLAAGADLAYPQTEGERPAAVGVINRYMAHVQRATHTDSVVHQAFLKCINLVQPPAALFAPAILWRVWRDARARRAPEPIAQPAALKPAAGKRI